MFEDSGTRLTQLRGAGGLVAARIRGEVGDVRRFSTKAKFAAANSTAPLQAASSGRNQRHRLRRGGNRQLNRAIYIAAITQARSNHYGRESLLRKQREAKTRREDIGCLNRRISDAVYQALISDDQPAGASSARQRRCRSGEGFVRAVRARRLCRGSPGRGDLRTPPFRTTACPSVPRRRPR